MKYWLITILTMAAIGLYLNRTYHHIYTTIAGGGLTFPPSRYEATLGSSKYKEQITMLALGDSLTAGVGASSSTASLPYLVAQKLSLSKKIRIKLINLAIPGAKASDVIKDQLPQTTELNPDIVFLFIGVNDIHNFTPPKNYQTDVNHILDRFKTATKQVYLINLPFLGSREQLLPPWGSFFLWQTMRYNKRLQTIHAGNNTEVIDLFGPALTAANINNFYSRDQFHPSDAGYQIWANIIYDGINR